MQYDQYVNVETNLMGETKHYIEIIAVSGSERADISFCKLLMVFILHMWLCLMSFAFILLRQHLLEIEEFSTDYRSQNKVSGHQVEATDVIWKYKHDYSCHIELS